jgi:hypothetical protein
MDKKQDRQDYYHSVINGLKIDDSLILRNLNLKGKSFAWREKFQYHLKANQHLIV